MLDSNPRPSFHQLELWNRPCLLLLDRTVVILKAWRYLQSSGIKLQYPTRGSYSTLMIAKSNWKVPLPLGEHAHAGIAVFLMWLVEARNAYLVSAKPVICLWAHVESKKKKKKKKGIFVITWFAQVIYSISQHTLPQQYIFYLTEAPYVISQLCASFDYFYLVKWVAGSLQWWISSNIMYQKLNSPGCVWKSPNSRVY